MTTITSVSQEQANPDLAHLEVPLPQVTAAYGNTCSGGGPRIGARFVRRQNPRYRQQYRQFQAGGRGRRHDFRDCH